MLIATHTYYSLRYGTIASDKLVQLALKHNFPYLLITDINNSSGVLEVVLEAQKVNLPVFVGMEFRNAGKLLYTAVAHNNHGFSEINQFCTFHNLNKREFPQQAPDFEFVSVVYPYAGFTNFDLKENEFVGILPSDINRAIFSQFKFKNEKFVAFFSISFTEATEFNLHKQLRAIDLNTLLSKVPEEQCALPNACFSDFNQIRNSFANYEYLLRNAEKIIEKCSFEFQFRTSKNKKVFTDNHENDLKLLYYLAVEGFKYRYNEDNSMAKSRLENEFKVIVDLGFASYYLIAWDLVRFAMDKGFYHVGRGSGANSIVAYCLKITDVDPIELNLYFERFMNPKRKSPPDFDIDFSWTDRDTVQNYVINKYGSQYAALLGATSTFKGKSIYRELGKIHGLPKNEIDRFIENPRAVENSNSITNNILRYGTLMQDFPNIRSVHSGGVVVSEMPLSYYTALDLPPKGMPTTQWDMYLAEDIGFEKFDILSQRGLGHIRESIDIIKKNRGIEIDIHKVEEFKNNAKVKALLKEGEAIGAFYVESPAMRGLLKKLRCDNYLSLTAASSIIRPGVAKSGMMKEYIKRFHDQENVKYLHPIFEEQLGETYGVMVYQEDVLKICHHFAGLDLADADVLRRLMSGKQRHVAEMERIQSKFFENCRNRGYSDALTNEVWRQIASFAGYSFSKAHSASYAVESFQSLYLKAFYPVEFYTAVINNFGGFYQTWVYAHEATRYGAKLFVPCVNLGEYMTSTDGINIRLGFVHVANLEADLAKMIIKERKLNGAFSDLINFIERVQIGQEQLQILIRVGAFAFTKKTKSALLWEAGLFRKQVGKNTEPRLFGGTVKNYELPDLPQNPVSDAYDEIQLLGFPVTLSYFDLLQTKFRGEILAKSMLDKKAKYVKMVGLLVHIKYVYTSKYDVMNFGTFLDAEGTFFDSVNFSNSLKKYPFSGHGVYLIGGKITEEFGVPSIEVDKMAKLPLMPDVRFE